MYERQDGIGLEVGSYAHRSILHDPEDDPVASSRPRSSPTEFPFTQDDFDPQLEDALELFPEILGDESVGQKYAINGLISLTPDGMPVLGETPEVEGPVVGRRGVGQGGPGGRQVHRRVDDPRPARDRPAPVATSAASTPTRRPRRHTKARAFEAFPKTYGIVHPAEQYLSDRPIRMSPMYEWQEAHDAEFFELAGWERAAVVKAQRPAGREVRRPDARPNEWDARWWSPIINAEHLAMRESAGIFDLSVVRDLRHRRRRARSTRVQKVVRPPDGRRRSVAWSTRRSCPRPAASSPTSRSCASAEDHLPGGHRRRPRHGRPEVVRATTCPPTPPSWT